MRQFQRPEMAPAHLMPRIKLRLALGLSCYTGSCLAVEPESGTLAYPASGVTVLLNAVHSKQKGYIHQAKQTISCINFSPDGNLLLIGEWGYLPALHVWWLQQDTAVAKFEGHQYGIVSAAFSKDMEFVVSVGCKHDNFINVWSWPSQVKVACNRFAEDIFAMSFSTHDTYFVTCGVHHVKFWYPVATKREPHKQYPVCPNLATLYGRPAILGGIKNRIFVDVVCGAERSKSFVYSVTKCGLVCKLTAERGVKLYKRLQNTQLSSVKVYDDQLIVGATSGHVYFFDALSLEMIRSQSKKVETIVDDQSANIYLALDQKHQLLTAALTNGSLCIWDISDWSAIKKKYYSVSHSKAITGLDVMRSSEKAINRETMVTVSQDATVRLWDIAMSKAICCECSKTIYTEFDDTDKEIENTLNFKNGLDVPERKMITAIKISGEGDYLATGNSLGVITVYDRHTLDTVKSLHRHTRGITAIDMFSGTRLNIRLLASGGRDRIINIFSVDKDFALLKTLAIHSGTITSVKIYSSMEKITIFSAASDRSLVMSRSIVSESPQFRPCRCRHTVSSVIDIIVCPEEDLIVIGRMNGEVSVMEAEVCHQIRRFNACADDNLRLERLQVHCGSKLMLSACSDRSINILSFITGAILASVHGHAKGVSGLHFSLNMKFIISSSKDGCIFVWGIPDKVFAHGLTQAKSVIMPEKRLKQKMSQLPPKAHSVIQLPDLKFTATPLEVLKTARKRMQRVVTVDNEVAVAGSRKLTPDEDDETGFMEDYSITEDVSSTLKSEEKSYMGDIVELGCNRHPPHQRHFISDSDFLEEPVYSGESQGDIVEEATEESMQILSLDAGEPPITHSQCQIGEMNL